MIPGYYHQVLKQAASPQAKTLLAYRLTPDKLRRHQLISNQLTANLISRRREETQNAIAARGGRVVQNHPPSIEKRVNAAQVNMFHLKCQRVHDGVLPNDKRLLIGKIPSGMLSVPLVEDGVVFGEQFAPYCFIAPGNVSLLLGHDENPPYGHVFTDYLDCWQDNEALWFQSPVTGPDEPRAGCGISPGFQILQQDIEYSGGMGIRTVRKAILEEVSIVVDKFGPGPAYRCAQLVY